MDGREGLRMQRSVRMLPQVICSDRGEKLAIPPAMAELMPGVRWGRNDCIFTPAFWRAQEWLLRGAPSMPQFRLGNTLLEEAAACLLGGHGIPAEVGLAAFDRVRSAGLVTGAAVSESTILRELASPLCVRGRPVRYRFARQKARYLAGVIHLLPAVESEATTPLALRRRLTELPGIGLKTASWIVRNWLASDEVAIIDIHILRAGVLAGIFHLASDPQRDYLELEQRFLTFSVAIGVRASTLDALIWRTMKRCGHYGVNRFNSYLHKHSSRATLVAA